MLGEILIRSQTVFDGIVQGMTYGILAVGLVLVYRSTKVINFAHGQIGVFCASVLALLTLEYEVDYYLSLVAVLVLGAVVGAAIELVVVRRLFKAPRVILFAATLGVTQLLLVFQFVLPEVPTDNTFPSPLSETKEVAGLFVRGPQILVLIIVPVLTVMLALFLQRTKYGIAIRAAADNPDAARTSAINIKTMSTIVWITAGVISTITAVLVAPLSFTTTGATAALGPSLILRALAAGLVGRMRSMPLALAGGIGIGVAEKLLFFNSPAEPGMIDAILFVVVLVAVLALSRSGRDYEGSTSMSFAPRVKPMPASLERFWIARRLQIIGLVVVLAIGVLTPIVFTRPSTQLTLSLVLIYAIIALSLTILTGWAGQLSLGQFAFVGLGAVLSATLVRGMTFDLFGEHLELGAVPFEAAVPIAAIVTTLAAMIVGSPALRVRGLFLAVTTLAFAVMATNWLLERPVLLGDETFVQLDLPEWLRDRQTYYYVCLGCLMLAAIVLGRVRRSGIGRSLVAVRDNELGASAFTISPTRMKLMAFGVAGAFAGVAGGLFAGYQVQFGTNAFPAEESLRVVAVAVIGGLSSISGAVLGAIFVIGLPALLGDTEEVRFFTSAAGLLIVLLYFPRGLVQGFLNVRDLLFNALARRLPAVTAAKPAQMPIPSRVVDRVELDVPTGTPAIATHGVSVRFGQRVVVDDVDVEVRQGEVVGLIGTNGAGKTTLMNAVGGFVASSGRIEILGTDVAGLSSPRRARLGLGRTFQSADLFADLTVLETVEVSLEARTRATLPSTVLSLPGARSLERKKRAEADELIAFFGLGRYQDHSIDELSTGTRRIVELACLIGLEARVLCLDEPTAGVAQRETEAFAPLVLRIREELGASVLIVEHDMPFIMGISDRVYCLEAGSIIAQGVPHEVRNDQAVINSYLGTDERAIARSDAPQPTPST